MRAWDGTEIIPPLRGFPTFSLGFPYWIILISYRKLNEIVRFPTFCRPGSDISRWKAMDFCFRKEGTMVQIAIPSIDTSHAICEVKSQGSIVQSHRYDLSWDHVWIQTRLWGAILSASNNFQTRILNIPVVFLNKPTQFLAPPTRGHVGWPVTLKVKWPCYTVSSRPLCCKVFHGPTELSGPHVYSIPMGICQAKEHTVLQDSKYTLNCVVFATVQLFHLGWKNNFTFMLCLLPNKNLSNLKLHRHYIDKLATSRDL